jgi:hypothetical protein
VLTNLNNTWQLTHDKKEEEEEEEEFLSDSARLFHLPREREREREADVSSSRIRYPVCV